MVRVRNFLFLLFYSHVSGVLSTSVASPEYHSLIYLRDLVGCEYCESGNGQVAASHHYHLEAGAFWLINQMLESPEVMIHTPYDPGMDILWRMFFSERNGDTFACLLAYTVPDQLLQARLPTGFDIDRYHGHACVSFVAFDFLNTKVLGVPWPGFRNFLEINLSGHRLFYPADSPAGYFH